MGGVYEYYFAYDDLYRLSSAYGEFDGKMFNLAMQYSPNGQILEKELMADFDIAGIQYTKQYHNVYSYTNAQPNTLGDVTDQFTNSGSSFKWDRNGNMIYASSKYFEYERSHCWDEENRLTAVRDGEYMSAYLYDHTGERTWKMAGQMQTVTINGQYVINQVELDRKTLYTNPYLIVTEAEYTKHYYIEGQRVASKLGGGWANALVDPLQDHLPVDQQGLNQLLVERFEILEACSGQQADFVYCQALGMAEPEAGFRIYPNPSAGVLYIQAPRNVDQVRIMNMMGQSLAEFRPNESEVQLRLDLAEGLYLVECIYGNERRVERLVVGN